MRCVTHEDRYGRTVKPSPKARQKRIPGSSPIFERRLLHSATRVPIIRSLQRYCTYTSAFREVIVTRCFKELVCYESLGAARILCGRAMKLLSLPRAMKLLQCVILNQQSLTVTNKLGLSFNNPFEGNYFTLNDFIGNNLGKRRKGSKGVVKQTQ